jgi:citrate lyase subunit beta/citryl-CoA lyase
MTLARARTWLFTPASRVDRVARALQGASDQVIADLEDAVPAADKPAARQALGEWLAALPAAERERRCAHLCVRLNGADSAAFADDLAWLRALPQAPASWMLAKTEQAEAVAQLRDAAPGAGLIALVETARGIDQLRAIAASGVARLAFGSADLARDLGCRDDWEPLLACRQALVLQSRLAGLPPPIDGVTFALDDDDRVQADAERARALGFGAKLLIHPRQLDAARRGLMPDAAELAWARDVIAASGDGAARRLGAEMIDPPVIERARLLLLSAQS